MVKSLSTIRIFLFNGIKNDFYCFFIQPFNKIAKAIPEKNCPYNLNKKKLEFEKSSKVEWGEKSKRKHLILQPRNVSPDAA